MTTSLGLDLLAALHIADLQREADLARVAAQLEPRGSPAGTWMRTALQRLAGIRGPRVSSDDVAAWPTLREYPYGRRSQW
jgi:hypothetical protein